MFAQVYLNYQLAIMYAWQGVALISFVLCIVAVCTQGCYNGGTCTSPGRCSCATGWTGSNCRTGTHLYTCILIIPRDNTI